MGQNESEARTQKGGARGRSMKHESRKHTQTHTERKDDWERGEGVRWQGWGHESHREEADESIWK